MNQIQKNNKISNSEKERVLEVQSLSYIERLERLMKLIELSYQLKTAKVIQIKK
jgi:hypothetical protein